MLQTSSSQGDLNLQVKNGRTEVMTIGSIPNGGGPLYQSLMGV
jgi:hypothetical protein